MNSPRDNSPSLHGTIILKGSESAEILPRGAIGFVADFSRRTETVFGLNTSLLRADIEKLFQYKFVFSPYAASLRKEKEDELLRGYLDFLISSSYFLTRDEKVNILEIFKACPTLPMGLYLTEHKLFPNQIIEKFYRIQEEHQKKDEISGGTIISYELFLQFASFFRDRSSKKEYNINAERGDISLRENRKYVQDILSEALEVLEIFLYDPLVGEYIVSEYGEGFFQEIKTLFQGLKAYSYTTFLLSSEIPNTDFSEEAFRGFYDQYEAIAKVLKSKMISPTQISLTRVK